MTLPYGWTMEDPAILSPDGRYRYWLRRELNMLGNGMAVFCMLNPSTADATEDDPTIRRCVAFARAWGASSLGVVNLFALRATDPTELFKAGVADPEGPGNDEIIAKAADMGREAVSGQGSVFVCGWGSHGRTPWQKKFMRERIEVVRGVVSDAHCTPTYLRLSERSGQPWHPLYLPSALQPTQWPLETTADRLSRNSDPAAQNGG
jgi:hypothetical protein